MGVQTGAISIRGKVGNVVGYSYLDSSLKKADGVRIYQDSVANPQSNAQMQQRARLLPLVNFYRHMEAIIKRGLQEVAYGQPSRRKFMSVNMKNFSGPWVPKGTLAPVPGPFVIARGSLVPINVSSVSNTSAATDLSVGTSDAIANIGALSTRLIAANTDIQEGDQLTFIACVAVNGTFIYRSASIVVSTTSDAALPLTLTPLASGALTFSIGQKADEILAAAAVIQSRDGEGNTHLRSFAQFGVNNAALGNYFGDAALQSAIASYRSNSASNDWPTQKFDGNVASSPLQVGNETIVALEYQNGYAYLVGSNNVVHLLKNANAYSKSNGLYLGPNGWIAAPESPSGTLEVTDENYDEVLTWLVRNYGYSLENGDLPKLVD